MARIELGVNLGMSEVLSEWFEHKSNDADPLLLVRVDGSHGFYLKVRSSQIHPDSDVFEAGDVGHLIVMRRFAEIKRLL